MKKMYSLIVLGFLMFQTLHAQQEIDSFAITKVGQKAPNFDFETEVGSSTNLDHYKGKLILINLFATWCPPCNTELPVMEKEIWQANKGNANFALFVFGREENWEKLNAFKAKKGFTFPILPDVDRKIFGKFATKFIPRNILIDENGTIIYQSMGYSPEEFLKLKDMINEKLRNMK